MSSDNVRIEMSGAAALVLFDWLARFNERDDRELDEAEERVLFDLEALLEQVLTAPLAESYRALVEQARAQLRDPDAS